jgi:hypothetical protein
MIIFHSVLSLHCFLRRLIPIICIFSSISTIYLFLGLPLTLVTIGLKSNILLEHVNLLPLIFEDICAKVKSTALWNMMPLMW